jgi:hypothetical protein
VNEIRANWHVTRRRIAIQRICRRIAEPIA